MQLATRLVQAGSRSDSRTGALSTPIYQSATFAHPALGQSTGYDYSRGGNPTRQALEEAIASLEGGSRGLAFASGMAAVTTVLLLFRPGDHLVVSRDLYGGTYRLLRQLLNHFGLEASFVDTSNLKTLETAAKANTKGLFLDTPTNPLMQITDLGAASKLARSRGLLTIVDNTFMTPYLQRPLELGADVVVHSASKYLGGHNDLIAGLVVARDPELGERLAWLHNSVGAILGPQDSWLCLRGLKTLGVRLDRHLANAATVACWLQGYPLVERVHYPGLPDHPGHGVHQHQASGGGGMVSFVLREESLVPQVLSRVRLIAFAESLGGVESLITFPARQTHADIPVEEREALGLNNRLLRLSVGLEDAGDILADLRQALEGVA